MKKYTSLFVCLLITASLVNATVRTVSNSPATLAQYNTIQAAINASSNDDTVYVHGSPNDYAGFTIEDKRLVIIGPGWSPDKTFPFTARVNGMAIGGTTGDPNTNPSNNSEIHGLTFISNITTYINYGNDHPNGVKFIRNEFQAIIYVHESGLYKSYLFEGNYFNTGRVQANGAASYENFLFQNNIFYDANTWQINDFTNSTNVMFNHNLFYGPSNTPSNIFVNTCRFLTLTNNIFVRRNAGNFNSSSVFNNNITFNAGTNNPWAVNSNSDAGGNVVNLDPQMTDQASVNSGTNNPLLNFTITAGPANNSGSDAKDMGLLYDATGSLNWASSRNSRLPRIFAMNIVNPTIPVGGTLNVQVEGRKSN
jgi:hypothetical protein